MGIGLQGLVVLVLALSIKGVHDVLSSTLFPVWFPPAFAFGVAVILILVLGLVFTRQASSRTLSPRAELAVWALLALSFICTTSLHAFLPFRSDVMEFWRGWPEMRLNFLLAAGGFFTTLALAALHFSGRRRVSSIALVYLAILLLLPNDDCANPFNEWWIEHVGASPLMYIPNMIAVILASSALRGVRPRLSLWSLAGVCVATFLLGMSHRTGIVW